jgi:hypothetical protein
MPTQSLRRVPATRQSLARLALTAFGLTFIGSRIVTFLIMARWIPDLYLHVGGTHVHHFNYGIFLLAGVGAYLLLAPRTGRELGPAAILYGVGLALTFDEFGMWLHLGGYYWQRASFDAVIVVAVLLGLISLAPPPGAWRTRHVRTAVVLGAAAAVFFYLLVKSFEFASKLAPHFEQLERRGPP